MSGGGIYTDTKIVSLTSQSATIKYNGTFLSNLRYSLGSIVPKEPDIIHRQVQLLNAQIPVSFYVINYTNNQFRLKLGAGAFITYSVPVGNYTANSLISAMKTLVNNANFNIVISTINGCLTFSFTAAMIIDNTITSSIGFVLGFASGTYNDTAFSITAPHPLNLLGIKTLQIRSVNLVMNNISSVQGGMTTLLATIPVDAVPFGMIEYKDVGNNNITFYNDFLDDLEIEIIDGESGQYINFNNADWCITLAFHLIRKIPSQGTNGSPATPPFSNYLAQGPSISSEKGGLGREPLVPSMGMQMSDKKDQNATVNLPKIEDVATSSILDNNKDKGESSNPDLDELRFLVE